MRAPDRRQRPGTDPVGTWGWRWDAPGRGYGERLGSATGAAGTIRSCSRVMPGCRRALTQVGRHPHVHRGASNAGLALVVTVYAPVGPKTDSVCGGDAEAGLAGFVMALSSYSRSLRPPPHKGLCGDLRRKGRSLTRAMTPKGAPYGARHGGRGAWRRFLSPGARGGNHCCSASVVSSLLSQSHRRLIKPSSPLDDLTTW